MKGEKKNNLSSPVPKLEQCDNSSQLGLTLFPKLDGQFYLKQELDGCFPSKPAVKPPVGRKEDE